MSRLVSAFVCGVQKGGTTSLHAHLVKHPELSPPREKELHFFDNEKLNWKAPDYTKLHKAFNAEDENRVRFETTPIYGFWPPSLGRLNTYNPQAKLIFIFRDPFDRAWSHWCMQRARKTEKQSFAQAIRTEDERLKKHKPLAPRRRLISYIARGRYGDQIRHALSLFPREQMLLLKSEDFSANHAATLDSIALFLGIKPFLETKEIRIHTRYKIDVPDQPSDEDRLYVARILRDDMLDFAALSGLDISGWGTTSRFDKAA